MNIYSKRYIFIIIGASYLVSFLVILFLNQLIKSAYQTSTSNRKLLKAVVKPLFTKQFSFHPEELKSDGKYLYMLQYPINQIKILNAQGMAIDSIGQLGDSTGQYEHITNYHPCQRTLAIADDKQQLITFTDAAHHITKTIKLKDKFSRMLFLPNNKVIVETLESWKYRQHFNTFNLIDLNKQADKNEKTIIPKLDYNGLIYDGFFAANNQTSFFISYFYNNIIGLDSAGGIKFRAKTVDRVLPPSVKVSQGWATYDGDVKLVNFGAAADNSFLYILSNVQQKISASQIGYYMDLYDLKTGQYHGSLLLPEVDANNPARICTLKNNLYVLYKNKLVCYNVKYL